MSTSQAPSTTASATEDEYVRLKLELAAKRASVDTVRLQARQLISKRDGLREEVAKNKAESEEQQQILQQTKESNEKIKAQIIEAEEERDGLSKEIEKKKESSC